MNRLIAFCFLLVAASAFGANPSYQSFRGVSGITVTSNPPNGTIIIDGSAISGTNAGMPGGSIYSLQWNSNSVFGGDTLLQYHPLEWHSEFFGPTIDIGTVGGSTNLFDPYGITVLGNDINFRTPSPTDVRWRIKSTGHLEPGTSNAFDVGSAILPVRSLYLGALSMTPGAGVGKVLTSDANGLGTWQAAGGGGGTPGGSSSSVQYNIAGAFTGDDQFQYSPAVGGGDPASARIRINFAGVTNTFGAMGIGSASPHEFWLMSSGLGRWSLATSGDLNPFSDAASYSIGTFGLNRRPFYVNVQSSFNIQDRYVLSASGAQWSLGNDGTWTSGAILVNGQTRMSFANGGNIGVGGTVSPTALFTITNTTPTTPSFAVYASNNPAPAVFAGSNGNITIGTNYSVSRLHVRPSAAATPYFRIDDTNGTPRVQMGIFPGNSILGSFWFGDVVPSSVNFAIAGYGTESYINGPTTLNMGAGGLNQWNINSSGSLLAGTDNTYGIGAASASRPAFLHLGGGGAGTVGLTAGGIFSITNGNVGVGTLNPGGKLSVIAGAVASLHVGFGATSFNYYDADSQFFRSIDGTPRMVIASGNVGIGTNAPAARLHVRPTTSGQSYFRVDDTNGTPRVQMGVYPGTASIGTIWLGDVTPSGANYTISGTGSSMFFADRWSINSSGHFLALVDNTFDIGASGATRPRTLYLGSGGAGTLGLNVGSGNLIVTNGNVGIGTTSPGGKLSVIAGAVANMHIGFGGTSFNYYDADNQWFRNYDGTPRMVISSSGIGLGNSAPRSALEVTGGIIISNTGSGLKIGPGDATLTNTLYASATLDFPSTVAGTVSDLPITVAGAADGDIIALGEPSGSIGPLTGVYNAWASNGVVYVRFANNNLVTAQDPASGTFKVRVDKFK